MKTLLIVCILAAYALPVGGTQNDVIKRVVFSKGKTTVTYAGKMPKVYEGYDSYVFRAKKGQTLDVALTAADPAAIVAIYETKVLDPEQNTILGNSEKRREWAAKLPVTGEYEIQVYTTEDSQESAPRTYSIQITLR
ncbi:MAG TPA: hypothetical protein VGO43_10300 [Pyrinomonadaceae bacterium]|jgi:hypothetical protein|nr:hypothetical protein [Pyrinomonadaceae bacterium]